jgi:lysophospholipase L1-like esterase
VLSEGGFLYQSTVNKDFNRLTEYRLSQANRQRPCRRFRGWGTSRGVFGAAGSAYKFVRVTAHYGLIRNAKAFKTMRRMAGNLLLVFLTVFVMAGAFELACRTVVDSGLQYDIEMWKYAVGLKRISADPAIGHEHVPGSRARLMGADVSINSGGLRGREVQVEKPLGATRLLMLGDSIVFGWGVAQDQTAAAVLERELRARGRDIEVINAGVGNYNTAMEVAYFLRTGLRYRPDIVVLNYFINDAEPTPVYRTPSWIARHSYGYVVLNGGWDRFKRLVLGGPDWRASYAALYAESAPGWLAAQEGIRTLAAYCKSHGIRLILASVPELHQLRSYPFGAVNERLGALAADMEIEYLDLLPAVQNEDPATLWVTEPDPHPNAKAQALMADALAGYLLAH